MPVTKCSNSKWRIGNGDCIYETREKAVKAYQAILASGNMEKKHKKEESDKNKKKKK